MAKRGMFTRSITSTVCEVLCINIEKKETFTREVKIVGSFPDNKLDKLNKALETEVNNGKEKLVTVIKKHEETKLYGMYDDVFLANALELNENRKPIVYADTDSVAKVETPVE